MLTILCEGNMQHLVQLYKRSALASSMLLVVSFTAAADTINWDGGNWNGGTANGYTSGSPTGTTTGGAVTVTWGLNGTADGTHSGLPTPPGIQPQVMNTVGIGGAGNGVLTLGTSGDRNTSTLTNYTTLTINFASLVNLANGALTIQDVDFATATTWQDFIAVQAFNGLNPIGVSYSVSPANVATSYLGLSGVAGIANVPNSGASQANADVGVNFADDLDSVVIYFFQGPGVTSGTGTDHGVWLKDINYTPAAVPEPSTISLGLAGLAMCAVAMRRKKR
jgi:hypothetical protein